MISLKTRHNLCYVCGHIINLALGMFFFGYVLSSFNLIQDFVQKRGFSRPVAKILITLATSFVPLGAAVGGAISGKMASYLGRRKSTIYVDIISIIGTILTLLPTPITLVIGRLIQGFCLGVNSSIVPLYINEIAPKEISGLLGTANQLFIAIGLLISSSLSLGIPHIPDNDPNSKYYLVVLGIAGVAPLIRLVLSLLVFKYDPPRYLFFSSNNEVKTLASLSKIYKKDHIYLALEELKTEKIAIYSKGVVTLREIFSKRYRRRLLICVILIVSQQLSGINAVTFFSGTIFSVGSAINTSKPIVYTIIMACFEIVGVIIAFFLIEKLGRKPLLIIGYLAATCILIAFGILTLLNPDSPVNKALIWLYMFTFGTTAGVLWIYISDILPDLGIAITTLALWLTSFAVGFAFPYLTQYIGWVFIFFAGCCLIGTVFILFFVKETKNKSKIEIDKLFYDPHNRCSFSTVMATNDIPI